MKLSWRLFLWAVHGGSAVRSFRQSPSHKQRHHRDSVVSCGALRDDEFEIDRRRWIQQLSPVLASMTLPKPANSEDSRTTATQVMPLEYVPQLRAYVTRYVLFGEEFAAIVDTGSPFLTVPSYCQPYRNQKIRWGCYRPERTLDSGYANTIEGFDNNTGVVVWRRADFSFLGNEEGLPVVFGVLGTDLLNGSGGVFLGLIQETDRWIRPSFLGQTRYTSFCVDLREDAKLVLSRTPLIDKEEDDFVPLVRDLKTKYGAPVVHYTASASEFVVNDLPLFIDRRKKPLYVIFDTGVSGMVVSQDLFDGRYLQARKNREKSLWGSVRVTFRTQHGNQVVLSAEKPITTPLGKAAPWKGFQGNLVVIGLAFLEGLSMTVDGKEGRLRFDR